MEKIWSKLHDAAMKVLNPREISKIIEAGGVAAASSPSTVTETRYRLVVRVANL